MKKAPALATVIASLALFGVFVSTPCAATGYALNDTGELMCEVNGQLTTNCAGTGTDAAYGRDVKYPSNGNGLAGFNFTKLAADGTVLKKSATQWACVKDNVTQSTELKPPVVKWAA